MFGLLDDAADLVSDTLDVGASILTLGVYGELSQANVRRILATGVTIYELSEATGVALSVLREFIDE